LTLSGRRVFHHDIGSDDVGRHQIGRELNAPEFHRKNIAERANQQCLAQSRHSFQQNVTAAEQADEHVFDDCLVADDDLTYLTA